MTRIIPNVEGRMPARFFLNISYSGAKLRFFSGFLKQALNFDDTLSHAGKYL